MANIFTKTINNLKNTFSRKSNEVVVAKEVYWVETGKTYHEDRNCPSLKLSKNVKSGTIEDSQKTCKCSNCSK